MANSVAVASVIAAVGVIAVIGTIAAVTSSHKKAAGDSNMSAGVKLGAICSSTLYPAKCEESLKPVVNDTANPEDILRAALNVALDEVAEAFEWAERIGKDAKGNVTKSAMDVCKKLLDDATEDLRDMSKLKPEEVVGHVKDLRVWLSGVMTYIYTCADGFDKPELKKAMDKVLQNSTELSSNALAIITRLGELLPPDQAKKLNGATGGGGGPTRRLLGWQMTGEASDDGKSQGSADDDKLNEVALVADASRKLLSETVDEISAMSHDANRRLLGLFESVDNSSDPMGRRRLLTIPSESKDDHESRRRLLSIQADSIADMSAEINRRLLAAEIPDELAGKRRLLSTTLTQIMDMTAGIKGQLDAINHTTSGDNKNSHRALAVNIVGTFDEIDDRQSGVPSADLPEWMPVHQRRLLQLPGLQKPNAVVAQDGSGNFKTINDAIAAIPKQYQGRYAIYVKAGDYKEYVTITKDMGNIFMYGDGPTKTRVIGDRSNVDGFATIATRTFSAEGAGFICKSMG
ncbi:unnamed protein product [Urochloa humidicola]